MKVFAICCLLLVLLISVSKYFNMPFGIDQTDISGIIYDSKIPGPVVAFIGGTHGNEKSGSIELLNMIQNNYFNNIKHGVVKLIPVINEWGYDHNDRFTKSGKDMNRIYKNINDEDALFINNYLKDCDIVIDFHEGWGWHHISPTSLGSTITPSIKDAMPLAQQIVKDLNSSIAMRHILKDPRKKFSIGHDNVVCEIESTLGCSFKKSNRKHILVEIPGQNLNHSMFVRRDNVKTIVDTVLKYLNM